uniref:Uncharacterized protein n=1 Tax=Ananas comosus var. bracteatus TaxID=296719 RepID=A0A6V7Q3P7_ANACO|nr:unnamed protein product [Ananas comosus var. bracteatus]
MEDPSNLSNPVSKHDIQSPLKRGYAQRQDQKPKGLKRTKPYTPYCPTGFRNKFLKYKPFIQQAVTPGYQRKHIRVYKKNRYNGGLSIHRDITLGRSPSNKGPTQGSPACAAPNGPVVVCTPHGNPLRHPIPHGRATVA